MRSLVRLPLAVIVVAGGFVPVGFSGCATPEPLVRLDPRGTVGVSWVAGRAVIQKELVGVRVASSFEVQDGALLALRIEVENGTPAPFDVGPTDFTYMICATSDNASCSGSFAVVDPEAMLAGFDERQSRERANADNAQVLDTSLFVLSAVADIATIASGRARPTTGLGTALIAQSALDDAARSEASLSSLASERQTWSNVAFRRTTVVPGGGAGGLVYIPIDRAAHYLWIHVRAGGQIFPFGFTQTLRRVPSA